MKVLTCIKIFLPGYKGGGPIRALKNLAEHLKGDVSFKFLTLNHDEGEEPYPNIISNQWNKMRHAKLLFYVASRL